MLFGVDLIVQLWIVDLLEAGASYLSEVPGQGCDLVLPVGDGRSVADLLASSQCAGVGVESAGCGNPCHQRQLAGSRVAGFSRIQCCCRQVVEGPGRIRNPNYGEDAGMLIISIDPEELILDQRPACCEAIDLAHVLRLDRCRVILASGGIVDRYLGIIVVGCPFALAIPEIGLAVNMVGAAIGDRRNDSSGGASVLSRVDAGVDGKLANRGS